MDQLADVTGNLPIAVCPNKPLLSCYTKSTPGLPQLDAGAQRNDYVRGSTSVTKTFTKRHQTNREYTRFNLVLLQRQHIIV